MSDRPFLLSDLGEKQLIRSIIRPLLAGNAAEVGVGDDAAVVALPSQRSLVVTADRVPEDLIAREIGLMNDEDLGRYAVVVSLSDLAAMGADPLAFLLVAAFPANYELARAKAILQSAYETAAAFGAPVVGGDSKTSRAVSLTGVGIGTVPPGSALTRSGARPGDLIFATGVPGSTAAALAYFLVAKDRGCTLDEHSVDDLRQHLVRPTPRLEQALLLRNSGMATVCQDNSDGVGQTLTEISDESGVGFQIEEDLLLAAAFRDTSVIAEHCSMESYEIALGPGGDFELLFGVRPANRSEVMRTFETRGWRVNELGQFTGEGRFVHRKDGSKTTPPTGWEHFRIGSPVQIAQGAIRRRSTER